MPIEFTGNENSTPPDCRTSSGTQRLTGACTGPDDGDFVDLTDLSLLVNLTQVMSESVQFISEPIQPDAGTFDAAAMAAGRPGLPAGFTWRDRHYAIVEILSEWKVSEAEYHRRGEKYYRKHYWRVRVDSGETLTIYAVRKVKTGENPKSRWWLYTLEGAKT